MIIDMIIWFTVRKTGFMQLHAQLLEALKYHYGQDAHASIDQY